MASHARLEKCAVLVQHLVKFSWGLSLERPSRVNLSTAATDPDKSLGIPSWRRRNEENLGELLRDNY